MRLVLRPILVGLVLTMVVACGSDDGPSPGAQAPSPDEQAQDACGPVTPERLDPSSALHLLPGAPEPSYQSDPPTSGPHLSGLPPTGVLSAAIDRPTQVLVLETGGVLIQHRDLTEEETAQVSSLATDQVVVAPNPALPAPVVATAWLAKQTCEGVDLDALEQFVQDHVGQGPDDAEAGSG